MRVGVCGGGRECVDLCGVYVLVWGGDVCCVCVWEGCLCVSVCVDLCVCVLGGCVCVLGGYVCLRVCLGGCMCVYVCMYVCFCIRMCVCPQSRHVAPDSGGTRSCVCAFVISLWTRVCVCVQPP